MAGDPAPAGAPSGSAGARIISVRSARASRSGSDGRAPEVRLPPELNDRFDDEGLLGAGGMGVVLLARDRALDRRVAIKLIRDAHPDLVDQFASEARILAKLEHENAVRVYDYGVTASGPFLVMEYVRGVTLSQHLAAGRPTTLEVARVMRDVVSGVREAHRLGIVHRDLKPANVFLDADRGFRAKVADFGLAFFQAEPAFLPSASPGMVMTVGTPGYMAPEQIRGREVGPAADVYALGVVLHEMLAGERLFTGVNHVSLWQKQLEGRPHPPSSRNPCVPTALDDVVERALSLDAAKRPTADEIAATLEGWIARVTHGRRDAHAPPPEQPYKLLTHFDARDRAIFFGRDAETTELVDLVESPSVRMLMVFGPCGIGKSSLLRAGLVAALDRGRFAVRVMLSGADPVGALLSSLAVESASLGLDPADSTDPRERQPRRILDRLSTLRDRLGRTLVLVVDQGEEVFTRNPPGSQEAAALFEAITALVESTALDVKVVLSFRTEFRGEFFPLEQRLARYLRSYCVQEIDRRGLAEAIAGPADIEAFGFRFEEGLPQILADDLADATRQRGEAALPSMQIVCSQLYARMRASGAGVIDATLYKRALGGAEGALARYVEERLASPAYGYQGGLARQLLAALTIKEGDRERFARARDEDELLDFPDRDQARRTLEQLLADHLVIREADAEGLRRLRLASEVICPLVDGWALEPDPVLRAARLLSRGYRQWVEQGRRPEELLTGAALEAVQSALGALHGVLAEERDYVRRSALHRTERRRRIAGGVSAVAAVIAALVWTAFLRPGSVELASQPGGAQVSVDGAAIGRTPAGPGGDALVWSARPGRYRLRFEATDHEPVDAVADISAGSRVPLVQALPYSLGRLSVDSKEPRGVRCEVKIVEHGTGRLVSAGATPLTTELRRGRYDVVVASTAAGWHAAPVADVEVKLNRALSEVLLPVRDVRATLSLWAEEPAVRLRLAGADGRACATQEIPSPPRRADALKVPAGTYRYEAWSPAGRVEAGELALREGELRELHPWSPPVPPLWQRSGLPAMRGPVALADLDGDGSPDAVAGNREGRVVAVSGRTGADLWSHGARGAVASSPLAVDLDADGSADVVLIDASGDVTALAGRSGQVLWRVPVGPARAVHECNPAAGDLDRDGRPDVVVGTEDGRILALAGKDGRAIWSCATAGELHADPVLADLDGDGTQDVVIGSFDRALHAIDGRAGKRLWSVPTGGQIGHAAAVCDLDADGKPDVAFTSLDRTLRSVRGRDGAQLWSRRDARYGGRVLSVADGAGGMNLAVLASAGGRGRDELRVLAGKDGRTLWTSRPSGLICDPIALADVEGRGAPDLMIATVDPGRLLALDPRTGAVRGGLGLGFDNQDAPAFADLDGDGRSEAVLPAASGLVAVRPAPGGPVWSHLQGAPVGQPVLGQLDRTGVPALVFGSAGCRVVAVSSGTGAPLWMHPPRDARPPAGFDCTRPDFVPSPRIVDIAGDGLPRVLAAQAGGKLSIFSAGGAPEPPGRWALAELAAWPEATADPVLADLDGDRVDDAIGATRDGTIRAFSGKTGRVLWTAKRAGACGMIAAARLREDARTDVVAATEDGAVHVLDGRTGSAVWSRSMGHAGPTVVTVAQLDGGRRPVVLAGTADGLLEALRAGDGGELWTARMPGREPFPPAPFAVHDLDGDGCKDVVLSHRTQLLAVSGRDGHALWTAPEGPDGSGPPLIVRALSGGQGVRIAVASARSVLARDVALPAARPAPRGPVLWSAPTGGAVRGAPALGDLDGDGTLDVVVGSSDLAVHAFAGRDGRRLWRSYVGTTLTSAPAIVARGAGGQPGVIVRGRDGIVRTLAARDGTVRSLSAARADRPESAVPAGDARVAADLDGDGLAEVIAVSRAGVVHVLSGVDGAHLRAFALPDRALGSPAIGDLDRDGVRDIVVGCEGGHVFAVSGRR